MYGDEGPEFDGDEDPSLGDRAQAACCKLIAGGVLGMAAMALLWYNVKGFAEQEGNFGGEHTTALIFGLIFGGCILCTCSSYLCLSPLSDSVDAITDCMPCLPDMLEELIDGMADAVVGLIAVLNAIFCTLLITGIALCFYKPIAGACMLGGALLVCVLMGCLGGNAAKDPAKVRRAKDMPMDDAADYVEDYLRDLAWPVGPKSALRRTLPRVARTKRSVSTRSSSSSASTACATSVRCGA
jgi:hypothetical protein